MIYLPYDPVGFGLADTTHWVKGRAARKICFRFLISATRT